jgi:hypothetical protein
LASFSRLNFINVSDISSGAGNIPPSANLDNPKKIPEFKTSTGVLVVFNQSSYDADDVLNITWNFGDGVNKSFSDYLPYINSSAADTIHSYSNGGMYNIILTAKEQREQNAQSSSAYSRVYVFRKGINVIPIISSPADGSSNENRVHFDISQSSVVNCTEAADVSMPLPYFSAGNLKCKYIHAPGKVNILPAEKYDLAVAWNVLDENGNNEFPFPINGTWSGNYTSVVNFSKYFTKYTLHRASVSLTYKEK